DFGIAKLLAPDDGGPANTITAPWGRLLTPDYASPEQIRGDPVTVTSDVYSLGVILYELLAGRRPLEFRTRKPEEMLRVVAEMEPVPPSTAVTRSATEDTASRRNDTSFRLRRRLSGDLDYIVLKALEKDPARRYGSVDQLTADIRRHLQGFPVLARGGSTLYLLSRYVRRHRVAVITGGLIALSLIAGMIGVAWQAGVARRERDRAERRFEEVKSLAHAVVFDIHDAIVDLPGSTEARKTLVDHALKYLDGLSREVKDDPALQRELGVAYGKIGDAEGRPDWPNLGQPEAALESYRRSLDWLGRASAAEPESLDYARDLALTQQRLADLLQATGKREEAMSLATTALAGIERLYAKYPDHRWLPGDVIVSHDRMGDWKLAAGDTAGATLEREFCMNFAEEMYRKQPDAGWRRGIMIQCAKTGELLAARNDRPGARTAYERSLSAAKEAVAEQKDNTEALRDLSIVYGMFGSFLANGGEMDSSLALYDASMKITEDLAAKDPSNVLAAADVASGHLGLGNMLMEGARYDAALPRFSEAFHRYTPLVAADSSNVQNRLGLAQSSRRAGEAAAALARSTSGPNKGRYRAQAIEWWQRSRDIYEGLRQSGVLNAEDAKWPAELSRQIATLEPDRN
ncbi:MAG TPA: protein kinase, partial [Candidatus Eisenbacteria bacterium]|nr:protein kinase [Candidatus Eisenbacteria bacterium]